MSIHLVSDDHYNQIVDILWSAEDQIVVISPFIKDKMASLLQSVLEEKPETKCTIISRFSWQDFASKASSLLALRKLVLSGAELYALKNLHSKLYLVDKDKAMIGSANFTTGGFKTNHELSLIIENESVITNEIHDYYERLLQEIHAQKDNALIDLSIIDKDQRDMENIMKNWNDRNTKYAFSDSAQRGAVIKSIGQDQSAPTPDRIQEVLRQNASGTKERGIWLKFEGTAEERENPDAMHVLFAPQGYPGGITCFPRRPSGILKGERIYIAALTLDSNNREAPVIIGRCTSFGYEPDNVATPEMRLEAEWMKRFPHFIRLRDIETLKTSFRNGISLRHLVSVLGGDLYPTTVGKGGTDPAIARMHNRRSHMRITEKASKYIDEQFDELVKKYGIVEYQCE